MRARKRSPDDTEVLTVPARARSVTAARTSEHPALGVSGILALQRQVGNGSVARMLSVQRDLSEVVEGAVDPVDTVGGLIDLGTQQAGAFGDSQLTRGAQDTGKQLADETRSTEAMGASDTIGLGTGVTNLVLGARGVHQARKDLSSAGNAGETHLAERNLKKSGADLGNAVTSTAGTAIKTGADIGTMATGTTQATTAAGGAAGFVALPAQVFMLARSIRQLAKQGLRYDRLKKSANGNWADPQAALTQLQTAESAATDDVATLDTQLRQARRQLAAFTDANRHKRPLTRQHAQAERELGAAIRDGETQLVAARQALDSAKTDRVERERFQQEMLADFAALKNTDIPSLEQIHKYTLGKQRSGVVKKTIATFGATLGVAGSIAACIAAGAAIAGGAVLMASPVGWGLAIAAAAIGLGVVGYKAVKRFGKFAEQRKVEDARAGRQGPQTAGEKLKRFGANLRDTLSFWKKPKTERTDYAKALLRYYTQGSADERAQAEQLIVDLLGIAKSKRKDARLTAMRDVANLDKYAELIAAKMAS